MVTITIPENVRADIDALKSAYESEGPITDRKFIIELLKSQIVAYRLRNRPTEIDTSVWDSINRDLQDQ